MMMEPSPHVTGSLRLTLHEPRPVSRMVQPQGSLYLSLIYLSVYSCLVSCSSSTCAIGLIIWLMRAPFFLFPVVSLRWMLLYTLVRFACPLLLPPPPLPLIACRQWRCCRRCSCSCSRGSCCTRCARLAALPRCSSSCRCSCSRAGEETHPRPQRRADHGTATFPSLFTQPLSPLRPLLRLIVPFTPSSPKLNRLHPAYSF